MTPALFPGKNIPNITKSNRIFLRKGGWDKDHHQREKRGQSWTKSANFESVPFPKINPSKIFQTLFLFARALSLLKSSTILDHTGGVRAQKPPKKGYFVDAESVSKTLEIFLLTTTNAILMKVTTIMYLHESVNRRLLRARNSFFFFFFGLI